MFIASHSPFCRSQHTATVNIDRYFSIYLYILSLVIIVCTIHSKIVLFFSTFAFFRTFRTVIANFFFRVRNTFVIIYENIVWTNIRARKTLFTHTLQRQQNANIRDETYRVNVWKKCSISMRQSDCAGRVRWPVTIYKCTTHHHQWVRLLPFIIYSINQISINM